MCCTGCKFEDGVTHKPSSMAFKFPACKNGLITWSGAYTPVNCNRRGCEEAVKQKYYANADTTNTQKCSDAVEKAVNGATFNTDTQECWAVTDYHINRQAATGTTASDFTSCRFSTGTDTFTELGTALLLHIAVLLCHTDVDRA